MLMKSEKFKDLKDPKAKKNYNLCAINSNSRGGNKDQSCQVLDQFFKKYSCLNYGNQQGKSFNKLAISNNAIAIKKNKKQSSDKDLS